MDVPFAVRGFLGGTGPVYNSMGGLRLPANLDELKGHKTVTGSSYGSSFNVQPSILRVPTRAIHGSPSLSESAKAAFANRPLSPHLALKKPQIAATYSISHRIFGAAVASLILVTPVAMKYSTLFDI